jgi:hypothetical protein
MTDRRVNASTVVDRRLEAGLAQGQGGDGAGDASANLAQRPTLRRSAEI